MSRLTPKKFALIASITAALVAPAFADDAGGISTQMSHWAYGPNPGPLPLSYSTFITLPDRSGSVCRARVAVDGFVAPLHAAAVKTDTAMSACEKLRMCIWSPDGLSLTIAASGVPVITDVSLKELHCCLPPARRFALRAEAGEAICPFRDFGATF